MTNWLITQTTRFKAAVTGAGGVENVADWGNDDSSVDDAFAIGGLPWEAPERYNSEAAIFQINKVRTPTHMVAGGDDIRVPPLESYLLDHALHQLNIPSDLLIFPGEGHSLEKNPWHGKIKVREELKWLEKYGGVTNEMGLIRAPRFAPVLWALTWALCYAVECVTAAPMLFAAGRASSAVPSPGNGRCPCKALRRFAGGRPRFVGCVRP